MLIPESCICYPLRPVAPDPFKLQTQIARFGASTAGMPPPWVYRGSDGVLVLEMASRGRRGLPSLRPAR